MNKIELSGEIGWNVTSQEFKNKLKGMSGDLTVEISSVGGSISQGVEIFNALSAYEGHVTTINTSMAASMASYIMLVGDTVKAYDNAQFMIHNGWTFAWGNHNELRKTADHLEKVSGIIAKKYMEKTGKSEEEVKQLMDDETFFYGSEMQEHGFVDEMISTDKNKDKDSALMSFQASIDKCALDSKSHSKQDGYHTDLAATLATMPSAISAEKIANQTLKDTNMVTQKDLDAVQAKYDALSADNEKVVADLDTANAKVAQINAQLEEEATAINKAEVIAFAGSNRNVISFAKEKEFIKAGATLESVMTFAMDSMENDPEENIENQKEVSAMDKNIADAIAKQNEGAK